MSIRLPPGSIFAHDYRVVQPLGQGGMGSVYIVEQKSTGALRALKLMLPHLAADADARARFEREAKVGSRIPSDHIVHVIGAGFDEEAKTPWIAMELLEGESLHARVQRAGPLSIAEARDLFAQLGHALGAAHGVDVVHRDLKPENLHVGSGRREGDRMLLKVLDFGIAKLVSDAAEGGTAPGTAPIGTLAWMAPEQTQRSGISVATDVWSLGLVAFWAFTGKSYWLSANAGDSSVGRVVRELVVEPLVPASERARELGAPALPTGFDAWFARAVVRDPKARFRDGGEACAALVALLASQGAMVDLGSAPTDLAAGDLIASALRSEKPRRRGRLLWIALSLVAITGVGVTWFARRPHATGETASAAASPGASSSTSASVSGTPITSLPPPACSNPKALALYASALQAGRDANWDHAAQRLREAAALEPTCAMIQLRLASAGEGEERAASFARAMEGRSQMSPRDRVLLDMLEPEQHTDRDSGEALERAKHATVAYPGDAEFYDKVCVRETSDDGGIAACRRATELDPDYADAWNDLGSRLNRIGRTDEAMHAFDRCIAISPTSTDCRTGRADLFARVGRCEEREADLRQAAVANSKSADLHMQWALALIDHDVPYEAALEAENQAIALMPEDRRAIDGAMALRFLAQEYGRWDEVDRHLSELTSILANSSNAGDQSELAVFRVSRLLSIGRAKEAAKVARDFLKRSQGWGLDPMRATMFDPYLQYARLRDGEVSHTEFDKLRKAWAEGVHRRFPTIASWDLWRLAYGLWASSLDPEETASALAAKPDGEPEEPLAIGELGSTYAAAGRFNEALPLLRRGARSCQGAHKAQTYEPLAIALEGANDIPAACEIYTRIVERLGQHEPAPLFVKRAKERRTKLACK